MKAYDTAKDPEWQKNITEKVKSGVNKGIVNTKEFTVFISYINCLLIVRKRFRLRIIRMS